MSEGTPDNEVSEIVLGNLLLIIGVFILASLNTIGLAYAALFGVPILFLGIVVLATTFLYYRWPEWGELVRAVRIFVFGTTERV